MKVKRQNCAYRWWDLCQICSNDTNPCTHINPFIPKKGFLDTISASWSIKASLVPSAIVSPNILMSQKYHNIKNKCNPFTKQ